MRIASPDKIFTTKKKVKHLPAIGVSTSGAATQTDLQDHLSERQDLRRPAVAKLRLDGTPTPRSSWIVTQNPRGLGHAQTIFNEVTVVSLTRWWPPVGVLTMLLLGWVVGTGSTPVDNWFSRDAREAIGEHPGWLLVFTGWWVLAPVLAACVGVALYRRQWRLAVVALVCPLVTIEIGEAFKRLFDRRNGDYLEYPSGHTALVVAVLGMVVLVAGGRLWAVIVAVVVSTLGIL